MKNIYFLFILFVFGVTFSKVVGQTTPALTGGTFDKTTSAPLEGVTIRIMNLADSSVVNVSTNKGGVFSQSILKAGSYVITTNIIGYKPEISTVKIEPNKSSRVSFNLEPSSIVIDEIEIVARQAILLKGDTMEFDANNYKTREFADADELITQIPGVQVDEEGNVTAQGEQVNRIIVDGKEFFSTDPRIALKNLPADIIAKVQIIDEKSQQARFSGFDDGQRTKVINIVTKPDRRHGYFGRAMAGKGDGNKFNTNASINAFNGDRRYGFNIMANNVNESNPMEQGRGRFGRGGGGGNQNTERGLSDTYGGALTYNNSFLNKKMEVSTDYSFRTNSTETSTLSKIEYLIGSRANQFRDQNQFSDNNNNEHRANARMRWSIDSVNQLDFNPNISYTSNNRINSNNSSTSREQIEMINETVRSNNNESSNLSFGGNLTFMHRFKKMGRTVSLNVNGNKNTNDALGLNLATTKYYQDAIVNRVDTNNNQSATNGYGSGFNSRLSFTENISRYSRLQLNYSLRNTASYSNRETFEFLAETGQLGELRDRLSNEFRNDFNFHSGGMTFSYNKRDTLRIQVGLNYQYGLRVNDRTVPIHLVTEAGFGSWLPDFSTTYYFTREKSIEFGYNTSTNTPSINQLQDFIDNQNELYIRNGNPNLKQEYANNFRFQYRDVNRETGRSLTTNFDFNYVNDRIVDSRLMTDTIIHLFDDVILGAGGQYTVPINMDGSYNMRMQNNWGLPIKKIVNLNFGTSLFFNNNLGFLNGSEIVSKSYGFNQDISVNTRFSSKYILGLNYGLRGNYTDNPSNQISKYSVFNHRLSSNVNVEFLKNFVFHSTLLHLYNGGINGSEGLKTTVWNASLGFKVLKQKSAEVSIKAFDLLNNAQNVNRYVNEISASNTTSNTLNRYFLVGFTYNIRSFGGSRIFGDDSSEGGGRGRGMGGQGGGMRGQGQRGR